MVLIYLSPVELAFVSPLKAVALCGMQWGCGSRGEENPCLPSRLHHHLSLALRNHPEVWPCFFLFIHSLLSSCTSSSSLTCNVPMVEVIVRTGAWSQCVSWKFSKQLKLVHHVSIFTTLVCLEYLNWCSNLTWYVSIKIIAYIFQASKSR